MVSVILPVYNGEKFLEESIQSVLNQTYTDWELIIVNDCSTDHTEQIAGKYVKADGRIHLISNKKNLKLPNSLNTGFCNAKGSFLTWTSDDNRYDEKAFERMIGFLEGHPEYGMVYCDMNYIDESGRITGNVSREISELYMQNCIGACFMYRKEIAEKTGEYNPDMFLVEDYDYWLRIRKHYNIYHLPETLYFYRHHEGSLTSIRLREIKKQVHKLRIRELDFLLEHLEPDEIPYLFYDMLIYSEEKTLAKRFFGDRGLPEELKRMKRKTSMDHTKQIILFGAGEFGKKALDYFGDERVAFFADNDECKVGTFLHGKTIISFQHLKEIQDNYQIVLSVDSRKAVVLAKQLESNGINSYITFLELINRFKNPSEDHDSVDWLNAMKKAEAWINNHTVKGGGIINNTGLKKSYPEVTGYFIPTLLRWGYRDLAVSYAKWLCGIQKDDGAWYDTEGKEPYVFDTAQILKGLTAVNGILPEVKPHIKRGCDWIISNLEQNGRLKTPSTKEWGAEGVCSELIHLYCLAPLLEASDILNEPIYEEAAKRALHYYMTEKREEILHFSFLSHFYAYVMEALCDLGETELAKQAMAQIANIQKDNGAIPAYENVNWVCSTGIFQFAVVWYKLGDLEHGNRALSYAAQLQNESGGWYGSYPVIKDPKASDRAEYPDYFASNEISWAVKYFLDAVYYKCKLEFEHQAPLFGQYIDKRDGRYQTILHQILESRPEKVCDVGCGKGRYIQNLLEDTKNIAYYAVDMSESVLLPIKEPVEKKQGALTSIPYPDGYFDLVYTVEALEHSVIPYNAVKELLRVTKAGGRVVIIDKSKSALGTLQMDEWEQWFDDDFFENTARLQNCRLESISNISYDAGITDGLFHAWILKKEE